MAAHALPNTMPPTVPPLFEALADLHRLRETTLSRRRLMAGLPGGDRPPTVEECLSSAARAGIKTEIFHQPDLAAIPEAALPCIPLLDVDADGHTRACTLLSLSAGSAQVIFAGSPEAVEIPHEEFMAVYSGYAVFVRPGRRSDPRLSGFSLLKARHWFWDVLRDFMPIYRDVAIASLVVNMFTLATPLFIMNVYDRVVPNNAMETLWVLTSGLLLAILLDFALRNARGYFVDTAGRNADVIIAGKLMEKVLRMRLDKKPQSTGAMVNNLREFEQVRDFFGSTTLMTLFDLPFLLLFIVIVAFIGGPVVTLPLFAVPLMIGFVALVQMPFQRSVERQFKQNMQKNAMLTEITGGLETVKSIQAEGRMQKLWEDVVDASAEEAARGRRLSALASSGSLLITGMLNGALIVWGVYRISEGLMTQGGLIACVILVGRALGPLMQFSGMITQMQRARMALRGLQLIMELPAEREEGVSAEGLRSELILDRVTFRYKDNPVPALAGFSLVVRPGEKVGFIGRTGSGKSTLARILTGLYQPEEGAVLFGGVDIRQMDPAELRARIKFMPQDNYLFFGSVRENIAMGSPWLSMSGIVDAAELSGAADFVRRHPNGYDMQVGERGQDLSGGQRQAVALARTLAGKPEILVLDEPSSNLDMAAEHRLMMRLKSSLSDKTLLIMTHRPSLLALVDRIVVLHDGHIRVDGQREAVLAALRDGKINMETGHVRA